MSQKELIWTDKAARPRVPIAQAVRFGNLVFTSGYVALDVKTGEFSGGGVREQTRQIIETLGAVLHEAGSSLENVLKLNCYLRDLADFDAFNDVYYEYFKDNPVARTTVQVARMPADYALEIEMIGGIPE
ncbi:MAG: Rid family detoxifying hydrolase [Chloroflexota bacterium]